MKRGQYLAADIRDIRRLARFDRESRLLAGRLAEPPIVSENLVMIDGSVLEIFGISGAGYPRYPDIRRPIRKN